MKKMKERIRDEKAYPLLECWSFDLLPTRHLRVIPLLLLSSSSMEFLENLGVSKLWNLLSNAARYSLLKAKLAAHNWKIVWEDKRPWRKLKQLRRNGATMAVSATMARGVHYGQAVVASGRCGSVASRTLRFALCLVPRVFSWIIHIEPFGFVVLTLLTWLGLKFALFF